MVCGLAKWPQKTSSERSRAPRETKKDIPMVAFNIGLARAAKPHAQAALDQASEACRALATSASAADQQQRIQAAQKGLSAANGAFRTLNLEGFTRVAQEALDALAELSRRVSSGAAAADEVFRVAQAVAQCGAELSARFEAAVLAQSEGAGALMPALRALSDARGARQPALSDLFYPFLDAAPARDGESLQTHAEAREEVLDLTEAVEQKIIDWTQRGAGQGIDAGESEAIALAFDRAARGAGAGPGAEFAPLWRASAALFELLARQSGLETELEERELSAAIVSELRKWSEVEAERAAPKASPGVYRRVARAVAQKFEAVAPRALVESGEPRSIEPGTQWPVSLPLSREALLMAGWSEHEYLTQGGAGLGAKNALSAEQTHDVAELLSVAKEGLENLRAKTSQSATAAEMGQAATEFKDGALRLATALSGFGHKEAKKLADAAYFVGSKAADTERRLRLTPSIVSETAALLVILEGFVSKRGLTGESFGAQIETQIARLAAALKNQPQDLDRLPRPELGAEERREQNRALQSKVLAEVRKDLKQSELALDEFLRAVGDRSFEAAEAKAKAQDLSRAVGALRMMGHPQASDALAQTRDLAIRLSLDGEAGLEPKETDAHALASALGALSRWLEATDRGDATAQRFLPQIEKALRDPENNEEALAQQEAQMAAEAQALAAAQEIERQERLARETAASAEAPAQQGEPIPPQPEWDENWSLEPAGENEAEELVAAEPPRSVAEPHDSQPATPAEREDWEISTEPELSVAFAGEAREKADELSQIAQLLRERFADGDVSAERNEEPLAEARRALHTLKGSGRMVGLKTLGSTAQGGEELMRAWVDAGRDIHPLLIESMEIASGVFGFWAVQLRDEDGMETTRQEIVKDAWARARAALSKAVATEGEQDEASPEMARKTPSDAFDPMHAAAAKPAFVEEPTTAEQEDGERAALGSEAEAEAQELIELDAPQTPADARFEPAAREEIRPAALAEEGPAPSERGDSVAQADANLREMLTAEANETLLQAAEALGQWESDESQRAELAACARALRSIYENLGRGDEAEAAEALEAFGHSGLRSWEAASSQDLEHAHALIQALWRGAAEETRLHMQALRPASERLRATQEASPAAADARQPAAEAAQAFGVALAHVEKAAADSGAESRGATLDLRAALVEAAREAAEVSRRMARLEQIFLGLADSVALGESAGDEKKKALARAEFLRAIISDRLALARAALRELAAVMGGLPEHGAWLAFASGAHSPSSVSEPVWIEEPAAPSSETERASAIELAPLELEQNSTESETASAAPEELASDEFEVWGKNSEPPVAEEGVAADEEEELSLPATEADANWAIAESAREASAYAEPAATEQEPRFEPAAVDEALMGERAQNDGLAPDSASEETLAQPGADEAEREPERKPLSESTAAPAVEARAESAAVMAENALLDASALGLDFDFAPELEQDTDQQRAEQEIRDAVAAAKAPESEIDEIDPELAAGFFDEAQELQRGIEELLAKWKTTREEDLLDEITHPLHTLKGSARQSGAKSIGSFAHEMEDEIPRVRRGGPSAKLEELSQQIRWSLERLRSMKDRPAKATASPDGSSRIAPPARVRQSETLRIRSDIIEKIADGVGQTQALNAALNAQNRQMSRSLTDLDEAGRRMSQLLRDLQLQVESQMQARTKEISQIHGEFDPLELDRFTKAQELARFLAEALQDVGLAQEGLRTISRDQEALVARQDRLADGMQKEITQARLVPFGQQNNILKATTRTVAQDLGKNVELLISPRTIEARIDRTALERLAEPMAHLLRNAVAHGIESPEERVAAGKNPMGKIRIDARHEGNVLFIELEDDGAGVNEEKVEKKAREMGFLEAGEKATPEKLIQMLFIPTFSTATTLSQNAGRGVGMDVVKSAVENLGGQIEAQSRPGRGMKWTITLPVSVATMQAALVEAEGQVWAIPADLVDEIRSLRPKEAKQLEAEGIAYSALSEPYRFAWLARLLGGEANPAAGRLSALMVSFGGRRVAAVADKLIGSAQIVVKPLGRHLARAPGLLGAAQLPDGRLALIVNPVLLKEPAVSSLNVAKAAPRAPKRPLVMVVDDSVTIRLAAGRDLERWGYDTLMAKDGEDALEKLSKSDRHPAAMLLDVEMPRMDGFELARRLRGPGSEWTAMPIAMITSRAAEKHKSRAMEIGVDKFLGKPYNEEELQTILKRFVAHGRNPEPSDG